MILTSLIISKLIKFIIWLQSKFYLNLITIQILHLILKKKKKNQQHVHVQVEKKKLAAPNCKKFIDKIKKYINIKPYVYHYILLEFDHNWNTNPSQILPPKTN